MEIAARKDRATVQARHIRIEELRRAGLKLQAIAFAVGLKDHSSVLRHLTGGCKCAAWLRPPCVHEFISVCRNCGVGNER